MIDWNEVSLGTIADVKGGKRLPLGMAVQDEPTPFRYLRVVDMTADGVKMDAIRFIDLPAYDSVKRYALVAQDIYISIAGTIGRVGVVTPELAGSVLTENAARIIARADAIEPLYLMYYLRSAVGQAEILSRVVGTSQPKLGLDRIRQVRVRTPDLESQRAIVDTLLRFEEQIENDRRRIVLLEKIALTVYRDWFVHFNYPFHERDSLVDSSLGLIPATWKVGTVADLCTRIQAGGTPRRSEPSYWDAPDMDWYKTGDLTESVLIRSSEGISQYAVEVSTARVFEPETILMAIYGSPTVGRLGLVQKRSSANQAALGLVADEGVCSTDYLWFVLRGLRTKFNQVAQGAAQQNISKGVVVDAPALIPPRNLIRQFTEKAASTWRLSHRLSYRADAVAGIRDLLLPRLVTGQMNAFDRRNFSMVEPVA